MVGSELTMLGVETFRDLVCFVISINCNCNHLCIVLICLMTTAIGRGFTRGGPAVNPGSFNRDRSLYHGGRGQIGRMGFRNDLNINNTYPDFHQRQFGMKNYFFCY